MTRVKQLQWSEVRDPDSECRYHHVYATCPLGRYSIEWKGWKDSDDHTIFLDGEFVQPGGYDLDGAKAAAQADYEARILACVEPPTVAPDWNDAIKAAAAALRGPILKEGTARRQILALLRPEDHIGDAPKMVCPTCAPRSAGNYRPLTAPPSPDARPTPRPTDE